jgi:Nucleotidyltransferase domain.
MIRVMDAKSELLDEIVARLTAVARPVRVIVFGSAATDSGTADSDIDLLIVLDEVDDARLESVRLRRALRGVGMPLDVIVMRTDRFEETKNVVGGIAYPANKYGKVIYEAA